MSTCGQLIDCDGAGGVHREIHCDNETAFRVEGGNGQDVCAQCAVTFIGDGVSVIPLHAGALLELLEAVRDSWPDPLGTTSSTVQADPEGNFVEARVLVPSARPGERLELRAVRP